MNVETGVLSCRKMDIRLKARFVVGCCLLFFLGKMFFKVYIQGLPSVD